jgi:fatty acid desaturase
MRSIWRNSKWDAVPFGLSVAHGALLFAIPSMPLVAIGTWWNSNTVSHNFIHLPFFQSRKLNVLYSWYLTLLLGIPQSWWRQRHLAHHGDTSKAIVCERPLLDCRALSGLRAPRPRRFAPPLLYQEGRILAEIVAVVALWILLLWKAPAFFLWTYVPGYLTGLALCYVHGYFEHRIATTSNYGILYNVSFLNDGYHVEHHLQPGAHWSRLPDRVCPTARTSPWPAVLRWLEVLNLEFLERIALRSKAIQRMLLATHEKAFQKLLATVCDVRQVTIVGGGMFPRTALIIQKLLPAAEITIIDASAKNLEMARRFLNGPVKLVHERYDNGQQYSSDLLVIPLAFIGDRKEIYARPPARATFVHDWIWSRHEDSTTISLMLLKRLNLVRQ